jgi:hypothetical protein
MGHQPLIELILPGDENRQGLLPLSAGAPHLLAHRRDRAREPVEHTGVQTADVDAELERGGGDDTAQSPTEQLAFDLASLPG